MMRYPILVLYVAIAALVVAAVATGLVWTAEYVHHETQACRQLYGSDARYDHPGHCVIARRVPL